MENKKYYRELDVIKGLAILFVVMGHSFSQKPINLYDSLPQLGAFIREFQMPLFFIASGFLFKPISTREALLNKTKRLIIPYFSFGIFAVVLKTMVGGAFLDLIIDMFLGKGYWFLYSLFLVMLICSIIRNKYYPLVLSIFSVLLVALTNITDVQAITIGRTVYYLPFFCLGYYIKPWYEYIRIPQKKTILLLLSITTWGLFTLLFNPSLHLYLTIDHYVVKLIGCIASWITCMLFVNIDYMNKIFSHFGKYSLQYYLNHQLFISIVFLLLPIMGIRNALLGLVVIFSIGIIGSYLMLMIEIKSKYLSSFAGLK